MLPTVFEVMPVLPQAASIAARLFACN